MPKEFVIKSLVAISQSYLHKEATLAILTLSSLFQIGGLL